MWVTPPPLSSFCPFTGLAWARLAYTQELSIGRTQHSRYASLMLSREEESSALASSNSPTAAQEAVDLCVKGKLLVWLIFRPIPDKLLSCLLTLILYCAGVGLFTSFVEFHEVPVSLFSHSVEAPLKDRTIVWCISDQTPRLLSPTIKPWDFIISKFFEGH